MSGDFFHSDQQKRVLEIDGLLRKHSPNGISRERICKVLANRGYANSRQTFVRDINHMREDLGAPIGSEDRPYENSTQGHTTLWFYRDLSWTLKQFRVTEDVLFSLLVASEVVERYAGHPLAEQLNEAYTKLGEVLNRKVSVSADLLSPVSFLPEQNLKLGAKNWKPVLEATTKHQMLEMSYVAKWKTGDANASQRKIHPYHIVNLSGVWYLVGSKSESDMSFRQYAVSNIMKARVLNKSACIPKDFDIDEILDHTFRRFLGDPKNVTDVTVRFTKAVVPLVENQRFSRREHRRRLEDGGLEISFPVSNAGPWPLFHIKRWVLSFGPDCEAVAPKELKELIQKDLEAMTNKLTTCT